MTQLMDNSNAHRPVPATEEIIANLPREVLEHGCTFHYIYTIHVIIAHNNVLQHQC